MEFYVPMPWVILSSIAGTLATILVTVRMLPLRPIAYRCLGTSSVMAGVSWCAASLLVGAGPLVRADDAPAAGAAAESSTAAKSADSTAEVIVESPLPAGARTLSVAPRESVGLSTFDRERRPAWVESPAQRVGVIHSTAVSSGPWLSPDEGRRALDEQLLKATREYMAEQIRSPRADMLTSTYEVTDVKNRLLKPENIYEEQIEGELSGSMYQVHALLEFDESFREEVRRRWREIVTRMRLVQTGLGGSGILLVVALLFGLLRADTATRGYYTRTLQFVAAVAILGIVAAGVLLAKSIPWL